MIPTSYFYKDLYRRHWFGPEQASDETVPVVQPIGFWQRAGQRVASWIAAGRVDAADARMGRGTPVTGHRAR